MPKKPTGNPTGRPLKEFDEKAFNDLVGLGCSQEEICWYFRDETGKPANIDTLTRWCKRTFGCTFQEYFRQNGCQYLKIRIRRAQLKMIDKSAAMAIFMGKNYLGQRDHVEIVDNSALEKLDAILKNTRENAKDAIQQTTE